MMRTVWLGVAILVCYGARLSAAEPGAVELRIKSAAEQVVRALQAEAKGDFLTRQRLLAEVEQVAEFAPAKWQRGQLRQKDGSWVSITSSMENALGSQELADYEQRRAELSDDAASHWRMANWCAKQGLLGQCRSHLHRILAFEPDNLQARRALGYRALGGEWIAPEEIALMAELATQAVQAMQKYGRQVYEIKLQLNAPNTEVRRQGIEELFKLTDPLAVPAVEGVLGSPAEGPSEIVIDWFAGIDTAEASRALTRYAVFHPLAEVRADATDKLADRPLHDFVPDLLQRLTSPVSTMIVPVFDRNGALTGYRQAFAQEKFDKTDFVIFDRGFSRQSVRLDLAADGGASRALLNELNRWAEANVRSLAAEETRTRIVAMHRENARQAERNGRISEVLSRVAGREFTGDAKPMWDWWDEYNETKYQAYKPERYRRSAQTSTVPEYGRPTCECFVAGTPVVTLRGTRAIEQLAIGDSILSRNTTTGELRWKPVLRLTHRPPEKTVTIFVDDEQFRCTGGHLFWVSGTGWKKASQLSAGDVLHAAKDPVVVTKVSRSPVLPTFNLQVADNATYFVGQAMVMTHDVTPRRHHRGQVPGQVWLASWK